MLRKWAKEPEHAEMLRTDPERALKEVFPDLKVPTGTISGDALQKTFANLQWAPSEQLERQQALRLFGRLLERVADGTLSPADLAADPEAAVQAAGGDDTPAAAATRVASAIRGVLGLGDLPFEIPDSIVFLAVEMLTSSVPPHDPPQPV